MNIMIYLDIWFVDLLVCVYDCLYILIDVCVFLCKYGLERNEWGSYED